MDSIDSRREAMGLFMHYTDDNANTTICGMTWNSLNPALHAMTDKPKHITCEDCLRVIADDLKNFLHKHSV
jgi:hypothetical protein